MKHPSIPGLLLLLLPALAGVAAAGCGDATGTRAKLVIPDARKFESLVVDPAGATLRPGDTTTFRAVAVLEDATRIDVTNEVRWSSSDDAGMTVKPGGWVQVNRAGRFDIVVGHAGGLEGRAHVVVADRAASALAGLAVLAPTTVVAAGDSVRLSAEAHYADGTTADVSSEVTWIVTPARLAEVVDGGSLHALGAGRAQVTATDPSGASASISIDVAHGSAPTAAAGVSPTVDSIAIGNVGTLHVGDSSRLRVFGVGSDGTAVDVTDLVTWLPPDGGAVSVDGIGTVTGLAPGIATVSAVYGADISASIAIQVDDGTAAEDTGQP